MSRARGLSAPRPMGVAGPVAVVAVVAVSSASAGGVPWVVALAVTLVALSVAAWKLTAHRRRGKVLADALLKAGVRVNPASQLLSLRARELTSPRSRRTLARSLRAIAREVERPPLVAAVPLNRHAIRPNLPLLHELACRVGHVEEPVAPHGMLMVEKLITDGYASPLYVGGLRADVATTLGRCLAALEHEGSH